MKYKFSHLDKESTGKAEDLGGKNTGFLSGTPIMMCCSKCFDEINSNSLCKTFLQSSATDSFTQCSKTLLENKTALNWNGDHRVDDCLF